jgi:Predicted NADH:ubiquinone oxidoreductase, subunit RnfC
LRLDKYDVDDQRQLPVIETNPDQVEILLKQHTGVPSKPVVKIGEQVNEGDLIAEIPKGKLGARLHASIKGRITYICEERIIIKNNNERQVRYGYNRSWSIRI